MKITKKIAERIALHDDATPYGGKAHCDEHLDEFMEEVGLPYGSSTKKVNEALVECGIKPISKEDIEKSTM